MDSRLKEILDRIDALSKKYSEALRELESIRREINFKETVQEEVREPIVKPSEPINAEEETVDRDFETVFTNRSPKSGEFENFLGSNLTGKIGVLVLLAGVAFGVKYAMDHSWIGPVMRIVLGYLLAGSLYFFSNRFRNKYPQFAAVLAGGACATAYAITYGAYSNFAIFPFWLAFIFMVGIMALCIREAISFDRVWIAHIGLPGAYAIPILLNTGSENYTAFFSYIFLINCGILATGYFKNWMSLHWSSLFFTWFFLLIFSFLQAGNYNDYLISLYFSIAFGVVFYIAFVLYQVRYKMQINQSRLILILINSFVSFGIGFYAMNRLGWGANMQGLLTILHAGILFFLAYWVYRKNNADKTLWWLLGGLCLSFIVLAVPVVWDGNWVTVFWILEAIALWLALRKFSIAGMHEVVAILLTMAMLSHTLDLYDEFYKLKFFSWFDLSGLTTLLFFAACTSVALIRVKNEETSLLKRNLNDLILFLGIWILYLGADQKITMYLSQFTDKCNLSYYQQYWQWNYTGVFMFILTGISYLFRNKNLHGIVLLLQVYYLSLSQIRGEATVFILEDFSQYSLSETNVYIFKIIILLNIILFGFTNFRIYRRTPLGNGFEIFLCLITSVFLSFELSHRLYHLHAEKLNEFGFVMSMLWALIAGFIMAIGILKKKKHLRIFSFVCFGVIFIKLFVYDSRDMESLAKTILYISLGIILLLVSFMYNRFKPLADKE